MPSYTARVSLEVSADALNNGIAALQNMRARADQRFLAHEAQAIQDAIDLYAYVLGSMQPPLKATRILLIVEGREHFLLNRCDTFSQEKIMLTVTESSKQKSTLHLVTDGVFDPGTVPVWSVDKTGIVGLFPSVDGMSCVNLATAVGSVTLTVTAVANGKTLTVSAVITVTPDFATTLTLTADAPVPQS